MKYALGAVPSPPSPKHYHLASVSAQEPVTIPDTFNLENEMPPVVNQGDAPTCVGCSIKAVMDFHEIRARRQVAISITDVYAGARSERDYGTEGGCIPTDALEYGRQVGYCWDSDRPYWPNTIEGVGPDAPLHRSQNKVDSYVFVPTTSDDICVALATHELPLIAQVVVTDGFETPVNGVVNHAGTEHGNHEIVIVGYDKKRRCYRIRNSWGTEWGEAGYAWMPFAHPIGEAHLIKASFDIPPAPPPAPPAPTIPAPATPTVVSWFVDLLRRLGIIH